MEETHEILINKSLKKVQQCEKILDEISSICCMPIRSKKMQETFESLENLKKKLESNSEKLFPSSITEIENCGSSIGKLYVSCCTEKRELLYQKLLKGLNEVHANVHRIMGIGH